MFPRGLNNNNNNHHQDDGECSYAPKGRNQLRPLEKRGKEAYLQHIETGVAFFKSCIAPSVTRNIIKLLKRTQIESEEQIRNKAGNQYQGQESEIAHNYLLLQFILVFALQKRIADNKGCKRKENIERKGKFLPYFFSFYFFSLKICEY